MLLLGLTVELWASDQVELGKRLYLDNQFREARAALEKALRDKPQDPDARLWLGYTLIALGELEEALHQFEPLEQTMGRETEYLFALSETYTRRARQLSERLASLGDGSARAHQHLAYRYKATGDWEMAIAELGEGIRLRPILPGLHLDAAEILWQRKKFDDAAKELVAELKINALDFLANLRYGQYLLRKKEFEKAIPHLQTATRYRKYPEAHQLLAFAFTQIGRQEKSIAILNAGLEIFPGEENLREMRRQLILDHPHLERGERILPLPPPVQNSSDLSRLRHMITERPGDEDALFLLSQLYSERGTLYFQRLQQLAPNSFRVLQIKGLGAEYAEDYATAEARYRAVVKQQPQLAGAHFALGHVLRMQGKEQEGIREMELEVKIDPHNHLAHYELGSGWLALGETQRGVAPLEKAVALEPNFPDALVDLAKAYLQLQRAKDAIPLLEKATVQAPHHKRAYFLLHRAYRTIGQTELSLKALAHHQKLVEEEKASKQRRAARIPASQP